ncbi:hypothetical protein NPIL_307151, partial [Nephila pilipes]
ECDAFLSFRKPGNVAINVKLEFSTDLALVRNIICPISVGMASEDRMTHAVKKNISVFGHA